MGGQSIYTQVVKASKNVLFLRYLLMASHVILILSTFILTLFGTTMTPLLVPQTGSVALLFGYLPIALFLSLRPSKIALDAARVEVAYLGLQVAIGMVTMGISISLLAGPTCHTAFTVDYLPITLAVCKAFIGVTSLNVLHCLTTLTWMIFLLHIVHSNDFAGRHPWRMSVARILRARGEDHDARVTLNERGEIVDSGGIWQLVDGADGADGGQWPEVHPQTPLLASGVNDEWDHEENRLAPPPYYEGRGRNGLRRDVESKEATRLANS